MLSTRADRLSLGGGRDEGDGIRVEARALSRVSTPLPDPQIPGALAGGSPGQQRSMPCRAVAQRRRWSGWDEGEGRMGEARALSRVSTTLPDPRIPGDLAGGSPVSNIYLQSCHGVLPGTRCRQHSSWQALVEEPSWLASQAGRCMSTAVPWVGRTAFGGQPCCQTRICTHPVGRPLACVLQVVLHCNQRTGAIAFHQVPPCN